MAENTPALGRKRCSHCKKTRSVEQFGVSRSRKDGLNSYCKRCKSKFRRREYLRVKREKRFGVQLVLELDIKRCPQCKVFKLTNAFGADRQRKDGLAPYCRECTRANMAAVWLRTKATWKARNREWRKKNPRQVAVIAHRRWARQRDATIHPIEKDQLNAKWSYWGSKCWVCGIPATDMDHVKPLSKGGAHMLCNLRPICRPCNARKSGRWPFDLGWLRRAANAA